MVLLHISVVVYVDTSMHVTLADGLGELGLRAHQISILWTFTCGGNLESLVYSTTVNDVEALYLRIQERCRTIRAMSEIWEHFGMSMRKRAVVCFQAGGEELSVTQKHFGFMLIFLRSTYEVKSCIF